MIGNVATAGALVFLWYQSRQTQQQIKQTQEQTKYVREEMESTLRPWIGVSEINVVPNGKVLFQIKNYGRIPAKIPRIRNMFSSTRIEREDLRSHKLENIEMMIFPDATAFYALKIPEHRPDSQYVGVLFEYEYGNNKSGEYGVIANRHSEDDGYDFSEVFAC